MIYIIYIFIYILTMAAHRGGMSRVTVLQYIIFRLP